MNHYLNPNIRTISDFLSPEICDHFISLSNNKLKKSLVSFDNIGGISSGRTSSGVWVKHDYDSITKMVAEAISKEIGIPLENAESFQIIHYDKSQQYKDHYDSWNNDKSEKTLRCIKYGGPRIVTALCYLNNVKKGGSTRFSKLKIDIPAEKGKLLIFNNTISETNNNVHPLSLHSGLQVEGGEKYAFNLWFRECPLNTLYADFNPEYYK